MVWNTIIFDGYSCGARISWQQASDVAAPESLGIAAGPLGKAATCCYVSKEFPGFCACICNDTNHEKLPTYSLTSPPVIEIPQVNCSNRGLTKKICNKIKECSWADAKKGKCKETLPTNSRKKYLSKKRRCKKAGCVWYENKNKCKGRWE